MMKKRISIFKAGALFATIIMIASMTMTTGAIQVSSLQRHIPSPQGYSYNILWTRIWCDGDLLNTRGGKAATDSNDNVISYVFSNEINQYIVKKYNSAGNFVSEFIVDIDGMNDTDAVDLEQYTERGETYMLPPEGSPLDDNHILRLDHDTNGSYFSIHSICIDPDDNIIIVAERYIVMASPPHLFFVCVLKYDQDGNEIWKNSYQYMEISPMWDSTVDSQGNIYIPCSNTLYSYVLKLDSDGTTDWFKQMSPLLIPFWWSWSVVLDSNENPIASALYLHPGEGEPDILLLVKFDKDTGIKLIQSQLEIAFRASYYADAALACDPSDNSVFYGAGDYIWKIDSSLQQILWVKTHTLFVYDLKVSGEKLIACGGWCSIGDTVHYYAAVYNKNTGATLLQMALNELLPCLDPTFQQYLNHLFSIAIDSQGNAVFSGGEGGLIQIKVHITKNILIPSILSSCLSIESQASETI